jgi:sugar lactone lactonase YvrE
MRRPSAWLFGVACLLLVLGGSAGAEKKQKKEEPKEVDKITGHTLAVRCVVFTRDGKGLISGSTDNTLRRWNLSDGKEAMSYKGNLTWMTNVALSPDGKKVAAAGYYTRQASLWEVESGKELQKFTGHSSYLYTVAFSPNGKVLATGGWDMGIRLWNTATGKEISELKGHTSYVNSVAFSPDGKLLASGSTDRTLRLWDPDSGKDKGKLSGHEAVVQWVEFSPDGRTLVSADDNGQVILWEVLTGNKRRSWKAHTGGTRCVRFSPDGKTLATAGADKLVRLWDLAADKDLRNFEGHENIVWCVAYSLDGKKLASASEDKTLRLWDIGRLVAPKKKKPLKLTTKQLRKLWDELGGTNADRAYSAAWALAASPKQSVPFIEKGIFAKGKKATADAKKVAKLIAQLDDDDFDVRDKAAAELAKLGVAAKPALEKALNTTTSSEVGYRIRALLKRLGGTPPSLTRGRRAVEVLEMIGTEAAQRALTMVAEKTKDADLKKDAKTTLKRLEKGNGKG